MREPVIYTRTRCRYKIIKKT